METEKIAIRIIIVLLLVLAMFTIGEGIVRYENFGSAGLSYTKINSMPPFSENNIYKTYPNTIARHCPSEQVVFKGQGYSTNSYGIRDKEYSFIKDNDTLRIIIVGDSWTRGAGVSDDEIYHVITEKELNKRFNLSIEVWNFGFPEIFTNELFMTKYETIYHYSPDMIIISKTDAFCRHNNSASIISDILKENITLVMTDFYNDKLRCEIPTNSTKFYSFNIGKDRVISVYSYIYPTDKHPNSEEHKAFAKDLTDGLIPIINKLKPIKYHSVRKPILGKCEFKKDNELEKNFYKSYLYERFLEKTIYENITIKELLTQ